jgi:hypothetical protein
VLPNDFPVPVVQPNGETRYWYVADVADLKSLNKPVTYYSLMHSAGANRVLFEVPQIPAQGSGLVFPHLTSALPGGVVNPGSPNLGDIAAILNSTGLFPELTSALSLLDTNQQLRIDTIPVASSTPGVTRSRHRAAILRLRLSPTSVFSLSISPTPTRPKSRRNLRHCDMRSTRRPHRAGRFPSSPSASRYSSRSLAPIRS